MLLLPFLPLFFHMALAATGPLVLVMSSQSSGYITMRNKSDSDTGPWWKDIPVPARHALMVSFNRLGPLLNVTLFRRERKDKSVSSSLLLEIWKSFDTESHVAHMYCFKDSEFILQVARDVKTDNPTQHTVNDNPRFQFFFSSFPESQKPQKLSRDVWNCSAQHYSSFQHHVDCNLKTECDDGRDETELCSFSSADCQGLVAFCDHCYKIGWSLHDFRKYVKKRDFNRAGNQYCKMFRGTASFPSCMYDPYSALVNKSKRHWSTLKYSVGLYCNDPSSPGMYKYTLQREDKVVFYHLTYSWQGAISNLKIAATLLLHDMHSLPFLSRWNAKDIGVICEIRPNKTADIPDYTQGYSSTNIKISLSKKEYSTTVCFDGHVTHKDILCGSQLQNTCHQQLTSDCHLSNQTVRSSLLNPTDHLASSLPVFMCTELSTTLSYSLVCDFTADCLDSSDESFCQHPVCIPSYFTCNNGQCVPYSSLCDQIPRCLDNSDKHGCSYYAFSKNTRYPPPVLINFDGISKFITEPMKANDSCPDSHYRCPGEINDCLPLYTRCNGMYDCTGHQDEEGCEKMTCPGLVQCRFSPICVHSDHVCDGWPHCPMHDDELWCNVTCPVSCLCQVYTFLCIQPYDAELFFKIRYLDASGSGMTLSDVSNTFYLLHLILAWCSLTILPEMKWLNLRFLDLSHNRLSHINVTSFIGLQNLRSLSLSNNPVTSLYADHSSAVQNTMLRSLDLSQATLKIFDSKVLAMFAHLEKLNLTSSCIHTISANGLRRIPHLTELYLDGNPVKTFSRDIFRDLFHLRYISAQNYKLCCSVILPSTFDGFCAAPKDEISSCADLLQSWTYRGFLWLMACLAVSGNIFCFCARVLVKSMTSSTGFIVFVTNLTVADFLMGVYMTVLGVADERYRGRYLHHDDTWKSSVTCSIAGFLSLLSSEASALLIYLITVDRFIVLCFPFSTWRFGRTSAAAVCLLIWLAGWFLALLPLLPMTSHWEFYGQTGICIPLPVMKHDFKGKLYSFSVMITLNFVLFLLISVGQALIYWSIQNNTFKTNSTKVSQDMAIAQRLISIALTDFMCWFPIGLCGILALAGIPIPGKVNVALAIFILPLNSAINPFMYTLNSWAEKQRKSKESELLKWMETHTSLYHELT